MPTRTLIIGIDGATWDIIDRLADQGRLPNLKKLAGNGVRARLRSIPPFVSPVLWTTIASGKNSDKHGIEHMLDTQKSLKCKRKGRPSASWGGP